MVSALVVMSSVQYNSIRGRGERNIANVDVLLLKIGIVERLGLELEWLTPE
jgi:hypothetical protein